MSNELSGESAGNTSDGWQRTLAFATPVLDAPPEVQEAMKSIIAGKKLSCYEREVVLWLFRVPSDVAIAVDRWTASHEDADARTIADWFAGVMKGSRV